MTRLKQILRITGLVLGLAGIATGAWFAYDWYRQVPLERVAIDGNIHAPEDALVELAALDSIDRVYDAEPELIADRIQRHPWVHTAKVTRWPTGTLAIKVRERVPVVLALDRQGRPSYYLDAEGYAMPVTPEAIYNVPLLKGAGAATHPLRPVDDRRVQALVASLDALDDPHLALLSEFELRGRELWLRTTTTGRGQSIEVRLGRDDFEEKIRRLHAFWHQAILTQPETRFTRVDLRFDSQIVTLEHPSGERSDR